MESLHRSILPTILALARNSCTVLSMETFHFITVGNFKLLFLLQLMGTATEMSVWHKSWWQDLQAAENQQLLRERVNGSCEAAFNDSGDGWTPSVCSYRFLKLVGIYEHQHVGCEFVR